MLQLQTSAIPDNFIIGDETWNEGKSRMLVFSTSGKHKILRHAQNIYVDGTFAIVNKPFYQLFSIHCLVAVKSTDKNTNEKK